MDQGRKVEFSEEIIKTNTDVDVKYKAKIKHFKLS